MAISLPRRARHLLLAAIASFSINATADPPSAHHCEIAIDFSVNGRAIAAPSALVEFGKEAEITLSRDDGISGWRFAIVADEPTVIHRVNVIPISIDVYELVNGESVLRATPHFAVAPGQRADLDTTFGEDDGRSAHIALVANLRSDGDVEALEQDGDDAPNS